MYNEACCGSVNKSDKQPIKKIAKFLKAIQSDPRIKYVSVDGDRVTVHYKI